MTRLKLTHFPAGEEGFFRAPVLIEGKTEAILVDGGFTYTDGHRIARAIRESGKRLRAVYVSQADPDYYFSLKPVAAAFPGASIIASPETVDAIARSVDQKLAIWGPQLKDNGPQTRADVIMPVARETTSLRIDGDSIEIVPAPGLTERRYLWVPSLRAIVGGVLVFGGVHVWTADIPDRVQRAAWISNLELLLTLKPRLVVPGHMSPQSPLDATAIEFTRDYLLAFEAAREESTDAATLRRAMSAKYPGLDMEIALEIGSKVAMGEMAWH